MAHVVDSLTAVAPLRALGVGRFVDLGSGGGFPGFPLAIALPADRAVLVESVGKKARFLVTAIEATGVGTALAAFPGRAEALAADPHERGRWPAVVARAVASLAELVELAFPLLAPRGTLVAWKRGDLASELEAARRAASGLGGGAIETVDSGGQLLAGHRLVLVTKRAATPGGYPRDPAARRRAPW